MVRRHRARWGLAVALAALLLGLLLPVASASGVAAGDLPGPYTGVTLVQTGFSTYSTAETRALDSRTSTVSLTGSRTATSDDWTVTFTPRVGDPVAVHLQTYGAQMFVGAYLNITIRVGAIACSPSGLHPLTEYHAGADGTPDVLAADFAGSCDLSNHFDVATSTGQLRYGAAAPYGGLDIPLTKVPLGPYRLGEGTPPVTVPVTYVGNGSMTPAGPTATSADGTPLETDVRFLVDTCSGTTLVDGSTCRLTVTTRARSWNTEQGVEVGLRAADGTRLATLLVDNGHPSVEPVGQVYAASYRALDSRAGYGSSPPRQVAPGAVVAVTVVDDRWPTSSYAGGQALLNLTAVTPAAAGYLSVVSSPSATTTTSSLNFAASRTTGNLVVAPVDGAGRTYVRNVSPRALDVVADVEGIVRPSATDALPNGSLFSARLHPVPPSRVLDTRTTAGGARPLATGQTDLSLALPPFTRGSSGVLATVTVVSPASSGWLRLGGLSGPSSVTYNQGQTVSNTVVGWLGGTASDGGLAITVFGKPVHVVIDVVAVFDDGMTASGVDVTAVPGGPTRIADSRRGLGLHTLVAGRAQPLVVPASLRDQDTWGIVQNLTAIPANPTWLVTYPSGTPRPPTSSLLATTPGPRAGGVLTGLGSTGSEDVYSNGGPTDLVSDVTARVQLSPSTAQLGGFARIPETLAAVPPATRSR